MDKPLKAMVVKTHLNSLGNVESVKLKTEFGEVMDNISVKAVEKMVNLGKLVIVDKFKAEKAEKVVKAVANTDNTPKNKSNNKAYVNTLKNGEEFPLYMVVEYEFGNGKDTDIVKYGPFYKDDLGYLNKLTAMLDRCKEVSSASGKSYFDLISYAKGISPSSYFNLTGKHAEALEGFADSVNRINFEFMDDPLTTKFTLAKVKRYGLCRNMVDTRKTFYVTVLFSIGNDKYRKRRTFGPFYNDTTMEKNLFSNFKSTLNKCMALDTDDYTSEVSDLAIWTRQKKVNSPELDRINFKLEKDNILGGDARIMVFDVYNDDRSKYSIVEKFIQWK